MDDDTQSRAEGTIGGTPISALPPSSFAYCAPGDAAVSTRCFFPIRDKNGKADAAHVRAALSRLSQSPVAAKARPAIEKAAKELGIGGRSGPSGEFETRDSWAWPDAPLEMRATRAGLTVEGYAAPFDSPSRPIPSARGYFRETIKPGAFNASLGMNPDVLMKYQHNHLAFPLGRTKAGTLQLSTDTRGLIYSNTLPDNEAGRPVYDAIERREITGVSITFRIHSPKHEAWSADGRERSLVQAELGPEMSYVDHPAYEETTASIRSLAEQAGADPDLIRVVEIVLNPETDQRLTPEDQARLMDAINRRTDAPFVGPNLARARERLAARAKSA